MKISSHKNSATIYYGALSIILILSCFCGLMLGYTSLSPKELFFALINPLTSPDTVWSFNSQVVWELRLPRVILAACVGMGLTLSGVLMQSIFQNPMADPYIMGISSGAALGATCAVFLGAGTYFGSEIIGVGAFIGSLILTCIIVSASNKNKTDLTYLLILGIAMAAVCSGITSVLVYIGSDSTGTDISLYWLVGNVSYAKLYSSLFLLLLVLLCNFYFLTQTRILNLMIEGHETALSLGVYLPTYIKKYLLINAILVGVIVMNVGLIGFVGLIIPHVTRIIVGADHRQLLPLSILLGGIFTVWIDILGRILFTGIDLPLGVTMAIIGTPVFILLLCRHSSQTERG